jgi:hypothetical protein
MYVLVGWLALQIAFGRSGNQADRGGAIRAIGSKPLGSVALWLLGIGFVGLALWQLSEAVFATGEAGRDKRERIASVARAVAYGVLGVTTLTFVLGTSRTAEANSNQQSKSTTAGVMGHTGGQILIAAVGLVVIAIGGYMVYEGLTKRFEKRLKLTEMSHRTRQLVEKLGMFGDVARGVVVGLAGVFLVIAAITYDPAKAQGVDGTLREFAKSPLGPWLLALVALGLVAFGAYSMCEARWRRVT